MQTYFSFLNFQKSTTLVIFEEIYKVCTKVGYILQEEELTVC